jgi:hypothetical protein
MSSRKISKLTEWTINILVVLTWIGLVMALFVMVDGFPYE